MVDIDTTTCSLPHDARRRSEPVHIREVIAEVWAILETCLEDVRQDPRAQATATVGPARPGN